MKDRLDKLCFVPPPVETPWTGPPEETTEHVIQRADGVSVELERPLFWYDPPWERVRIDSADMIAATVAQTGVAVSALRSDLSAPEGDPTLHSCEIQDDERNPFVPVSSDPLPRIVPYRPERYGLCDRDFDGARIVDVRLMMNRNMSGRFAFSPQQIERWEATPSSAPLAGGSWVPAATFPPDVDSIENLAYKFEQLRWLAPQAAIFVSIGPHRLVSELGAVLSCAPDGVILRLDELNLIGIELANAVQGTRRWMNDQQASHVPLWVVPGMVTPDDVVKLIALGAAAVAVDCWCDEVIDLAVETQQASTSTLGYSSLSPSRDNEVVEMIEYDLAANVERISGLLHSIQYQPEGHQLASLSADWSHALGIAPLTLPVSRDP
ncbi:MAG: hypothetical protein ACR2NZ_22695 [Rubripirellula sp.]